MGAFRARLVGSRERGVRSNVLRDTGRLARRAVEHVAEDARRLGILGVLAGAAGELQLAQLLVLLGIQHVGAFGAEAERDLLELSGAGFVGRGRLRACHCSGLRVRVRGEGSKGPRGKW